MEDHIGVQLIVILEIIIIIIQSLNGLQVLQIKRILFFSISELIRNILKLNI
jgi:hypothetical protein